ncbi:hypothetical protein [Croceivirga thetidis]|uniref:Tetratricopeptide repeat protein n=1 Tax=Croceivirga thetidis TaxID=2721623 RepID=A0ABX1GS54_9FLAO|nr:hypothetical protein [Croceivirga thetidis]NKI32463.1 hypothetical protein [Croceivirga thetidis]
MNNFFEELKRRNVYKAATAYAITSWLLIQIANTIAPNLNLPEAVPATITKILIVGFPIALILAWLYELTPNGFKLTKESKRSEEDGKKIGTKLNKGIIVILALLVSLLLVDRFFFRGKTLFQDKSTASIAVLPFANFSPDKENEYMADGLTEQILDELANISGLKVPARTSSFAFKNKNQDIRYIAEQLEVNYILEGSVRYHRGRVRITAQLINAANGYHLWSNTYDENFDEVFDIQESISRKVANELKVRLLPKDQEALASRLTENSEAYKLYLKSREFSQLRDDTSIRKGVELLEQALQLEPNFAEAHAELAFLYLQWHFYGSLDKKTRDEKSKYHMEKALELAPEKPEVLRANVNYRNRVVNKNVARDTAANIRDLRKAIELKPNFADAHYSLYLQLQNAKQFKLAYEQLEKTVELDPLNNFYTSQFASKLYQNMNQPERAMALLDKMIRNDTVNKPGSLLKALILVKEPYGDLVGSFRLRHENLKKDPTNRAKLNHNMLGALDLDIWPLAEKYANTIQMRYSETDAIYYDVLYFHYFKKNEERIRELLQYLIDEGQLEPEDEILELAYLELLDGDVKAALGIFENGFPDVANGSVFEKPIVYPYNELLVEYIEYLRLDNQKDKADSYATKLCSHNQNIIDNDPVSNGYRDQLLLDCYYLSDQKEKFITYLDEVFFIKKNRQAWFGNMKSGGYQRYEDDPDYQELFKRIEAETHRMRAEVIDYLKKEGDWNESWDVELGLN